MLTVLGMTLTPQLLRLMKTDTDVLPNSIDYFRMYFAGSIAIVMYNLCVGILQAVGDSRHPLYYLILSSLVNIALDLLFVGVPLGGLVCRTGHEYFAVREPRPLYLPSVPL